MNQHDYVRGCLAFYEEEGLTPEKGWDEAHYPDPKDQGDETIWLRHEDHQAQGLWQSKEYDQCCFFPGNAKHFLTHGPFVSGWFELWDIYEKYKSEPGRKGGEIGGKIGGNKTAKESLGIHAPGVVTFETCSKGGKKSAEMGVGVHALPPEMLSKNGKAGGEIGGNKVVKEGLGIHAPGVRTFETRSKGGKTGGKIVSGQRYQNTDPNHPPHISTAPGLANW